jgi:hypothetical protein
MPSENEREEMIDRKHFKTQANFDGFVKMHPKLQEVALDAFNYAIIIGVEHPVFTETATTAEEDKALKRVSKTHHECRAFDFRVIDWSGEQIDAMIEYLNKKYGHIGALLANGKRAIVVYHDSGHGFHFHVQLDSSYALKAIFSGEAV